MYRNRARLLRLDISKHTAVLPKERFGRVDSRRPQAKVVANCPQGCIPAMHHRIRRRPEGGEPPKPDGPYGRVEPRQMVKARHRSTIDIRAMAYLRTNALDSSRVMSPGELVDMGQRFEVSNRVLPRQTRTVECGTQMPGVLESTPEQESRSRSTSTSCWYTVFRNPSNGSPFSTA